MAAKYRKIDPRIWRDEKFKKLNSDEKLIALYCLTAQANRCGIFVFSPAMAAEELEMSLNTFRERFENVIKTMNWEYDSTVRVLYFPTWWKYNPPENQNVLIGVLDDLNDLPQTTLLQRFYVNKRYLRETLHKTFSERIPKPLAIQEQEQEQEQECIRTETHTLKKTIFKPPTLEDVQAYLADIKKQIDAQRFIDFYESKGWMIGKNKMKDWRAAVRNWKSNENVKQVEQVKRANAEEKIRRANMKNNEHTSNGTLPALSGEEVKAAIARYNGE